MNQNSKVEKFLPLGTVVLLKNGKKKLMITGYCCFGNEHEAELFDYAACTYPEGIIDSNKGLMFNHDQIDKVFFVGYVDEKHEKFSDKLIELEEQILEKMNNK